MLLFYIILWVPCNFINKTLHQIRNTEAMLLVSTAREDDPIVQDDLHSAEVGYGYLFSNPITNFFSDTLERKHKLVTEAEKELDIIWLIKKIKIT